VAFKKYIITKLGRSLKKLCAHTTIKLKAAFSWRTPKASKHFIKLFQRNPVVKVRRLFAAVKEA
jgi:hypothetical protein